MNTKQTWAKTRCARRNHAIIALRRATKNWRRNKINERRERTAQRTQAAALVAMSPFDYRCCCCWRCEGVTGVKVRIRMPGCGAVSVECSSLYRDGRTVLSGPGNNWLRVGRTGPPALWYSLAADNGINGSAKTSENCSRTNWLGHGFIQKLTCGV